MQHEDNEVSDTETEHATRTARQVSDTETEHATRGQRGQSHRHSMQHEQTGQ